MIGRLPLLVLAATLAALAAIWDTTQAHARVVALVFDDSGSMKYNIQLPTFGVQLLVSTLDGRQGRDRLFSMRLSQFETAFGKLHPIQFGGVWQNVVDFGMRPGEVRASNVGKIFDAVHPGATLVTTHDLRTEDRIEGAINNIRSTWPVATANTPYEPIEVMLDLLSRETTPGEQAYLIVVTDGGFYDGAPGAVPPPPVLRQSYEEYKRRIKGPVSVLFLFMDSGEKAQDGRTLRQVAEDQQVYTTLMDVFGGDRNADAVFVHNGKELKDALVRDVAKISATDIDRNNSIVRRNGNAIEFNLPFSLTRVITLWTGPKGKAAPHPLPSSLPKATSMHFSPSMAQGDRLSEPLVGDVTQFLFEPALGPGQHRVEFSDQVGDDTIILFRSEIGLQVKFVDAAGHELRPDARGAIEVSRGRKYKLVVELQDRVPGGGPVVPSRIANAAVTATVAGPSGTTKALDLSASDKDSGFVGDITFDNEGTHSVSTVLRMPGFVTSRADPVSVKVVERDLSLAIQLERLESCPGAPCPDGVLPIRLQSGNLASTVGRIRVRTDQALRRPGEFHLEITNLEPGIVILDPDHHPVTPDSSYPIAGGQSVSFDVVRQPGWKPNLRSVAAAPEVAVTATAVSPLEGRATLAFRIRPNAPDPVLRYRGHDLDPSGTQPMIARLPGLDGAPHAFDFAIENALELPRPDNLSANLGGGLLGLLASADVQIPPASDTGASGYAFTVRPRARLLCQCFLGLALLAGANADVPVTVTYDPRDGRPAASAVSPLRFTTEGWNAFWLWSGCGWLIFALALLAYILRVLWCMIIAAQRFPASARFYIFEAGFTESMSKPVRNSIWSDLRRALVLRVPRHSYRIDGLIVEADGAQMRMRAAGHVWPNYVYLRRGMLLQDIADEMAKRKQAPSAADAVIPAPWNSAIEDPAPGGRKIIFIRTRQQVTQAALTRTLEAT